MIFMESKRIFFRKNLLLSLIFFISCLSPVYISAQKITDKKLTPREIAQQTLPSTVLLVMDNNETQEAKSGSGFFIAEDIVVTNFHVIKETTEGYAKIYGQDRIYEVLGVVGIDEKNDLALLKIKGIKGKPLKLNTDDSTAIGDEVFAVGNPKGLEGTFSQGIVSSIRKTEKTNLLQITASISAGSSGGAILNNKGQVVGVAVGAIESGQSLNFAIPVSLLRLLITKPKSLASLASINLVEEIKAGTIRKNSIGMELVYIPAGNFMMGADKSSSEKPIHNVTFKQGFWMGKYEVTQKQWEQVTGITFRQQKAKVSPNFSIVGEGSNYPMYFVNWEDSKEFIRQLNLMTLFEDNFVYSLPSEAEWEYAARAGTKSDYYGIPDEIAWYSDNSGGKTHIVGQKKPNAFGLYDMSGNVFEWCEDSYVDGYIDAPVNGSAYITQGGSTNRVMRGGSWFFFGSFLRLAARNDVLQNQRGDMFGFRVVAQIKK